VERLSLIHLSLCPPIKLAAQIKQSRFKLVSAVKRSRRPQVFLGTQIPLHLLAVFFLKASPTKEAFFEWHLLFDIKVFVKDRDFFFLRVQVVFVGSKHAVDLVLQVLPFVSFEEL